MDYFNNDVNDADQQLPIEITLIINCLSIQLQQEQAFALWLSEKSWKSCNL
jgi:hypothetical protein